MSDSSEHTQQSYETEQNYKLLFESAAVGIASVGLNGKYIRTNESWCTMLGYSQDELNQLTFADISHPEDRSMSIAKIDEMIRGEVDSYHIEKRYIRKDGTTLWANMSASMVFDIDDKPQSYIAVIVDVSERKNSQKRLLDLSAAIDGMTEPVVVFDENDCFSFINEAYRELNKPVIESIQIGELFEDHIRELVKKGFAPNAIGREEEWINERLDQHRNPSGYFELKRQDGEWYLGVEKMLPSGGRVMLLTSITDMKKVEGELTDATMVAKSANRAKTDLMANMSHELRTPLNAIIGFSDAIKSEIYGPFGNDKYHEYIDDIHNSGNHLLELINDILDVSAIEAGAIELHEENINIANAVNASVRIIQPRAHNGMVTVTSSISSGTPLIKADERRLKQIFLNLLSNAVKFTPEGGEVSVTSWLNDSGSFSISITDTGIGMEEDQIEKAMSKFGQIDSGLNRKHEGTGLGLPLTVGLMESHGGTLKVKSKKGHGTEIIVTFPKERVAQNVC